MNLGQAIFRTMSLGVNTRTRLGQYKLFQVFCETNFYMMALLYEAVLRVTLESFIYRMAYEIGTKADVVYAVPPNHPLGRTPSPLLIDFWNLESCSTYMC